MKCPVCNTFTEVIESRRRKDNVKYRRYQCANMHRFVTHEKVVRVIASKERNV